MSRTPRIPALFVLALLAGCQSMDTDTFGVARTNEPAKVELTTFGDTFQGLQTIAPVEYHASDQALAEAKNQFRQENYGNAGALFYTAVKLSPKDGEAWLGLAACSDRIRRFDLADKAYREAHRLIGSTPEYYNNIGYSYLLRGDLRQARTAFLKAYELKPDDPTIANNLRLLQSSVASIQR